MNPQAEIRTRIAAALAVMAAVPGLHAQTPLERSAEAYMAANAAEVALRDKPPAERTRSEYLELIRQYERVYLITPHTGYADDALIRIAALYGEIQATEAAVRTLEFLVREYPASRFVESARADLMRLTVSPSPENEHESESPEPDGTPVRVENIRFWESPRSARVVVDMAGEPTFAQGDARNPPRVFVDIAGARIGASLEQLQFPGTSVMLHNVRVGQHDADSVRVVMDLVGRAAATAFTLRDPDRLIIDLRADPVPDTPAAPAAAGTGPDPAASEAVEADPAANRSGEPPRPASPGTNDAHSLIRSLGLKVGRVVIDPGHGGNDTGTIGPGGLTEKALVLDLALRLRERIEREIGAEVVLTRNDDSYVPLEARTAMANQAQADLFLSIHANASRDPSIRGFETYVLNLAASRADLEIAARENAASQASISELQDLLRRIAHQDTLEESRELARHVQRAMAGHADFGRDRGVKQAPFVVLIGADMPAILTEVSFISNPEDERLLQGEARRGEIVDALLAGVRAYADTLGGFESASVEE